MVIGFFLAFLALWGWHWWRVRVLTENDRNGYSCLQKLCLAEFEYREKDLDGNGVNDYWTGDIAGLQRHGLIPREIAEADAEPLVPLVPKPVPYKGYLFRVLVADDSETPPEAYRQDTDKSAGKVHHRNKFGVVAYPAQPGVTGNYVLVVNHDHILLRKHVSEAPIPKSWPSDAEFPYWSKH